MTKTKIIIPFITSLMLLQVASLKAAEPAMTEQRNISFNSLGYEAPLRLRGVESSTAVRFGIPLDEVVRKAHLNLHYSVSPSLIRDWSHINVRLNDRLLSTIRFGDISESADRTAKIALDPKLFADYNSLSFELIGHYTETCEFVGHTSLWAEIDPQSNMELELETLPPSARLENLPAPFFDPRDNQSLVIPLVVNEVTDESLHAAGILASWLGTLANYRDLRFKLTDQLPQGHSIVLGGNQELWDRLAFTPSTDPSVSIFVHPGREQNRILLLHGGENQQLTQAALGVAFGHELMSGQSSRIAATIAPTQRQPYDAPRWLATDGPVRFSSLVQEPSDLDAVGNTPAPISIDFRLPPDLFTGFGDSAVVKLNYRYTPPSTRDNSRLSIHVNERFAQAYRLAADDEVSGTKRFYLPLFDRAFFAATSTAQVPAFQLEDSNRLDFRFNMDFHYLDPCTDMPSGAVYSAIDEDSSIDVSDFPHYMEMPNLASFATSGFPFSRYADLSETAILLPAQPTRVEMETYLYLMARFSRQTGAVASHFSLLRQGETVPEDKDILLIGHQLDRLQAPSTTPLLIELQARILDTAFSNARRDGRGNQLPSMTIKSDGPLAALVGFESPSTAGRSVVSVTGNSDLALLGLIEGLENMPGRGKIHGNVSIFNTNGVTSFDLGTHYATGQLSFGQKIWLWLSRHPTAMAVLGIVAGLIFAGLLFAALRTIAARRLSA